MSESIKTDRAKGTVKTTSWDPKPYDELKDGPTLVEIHVTETFTGDIEGEGTVRFLQTLKKDGSASFVGVERIAGTLAGKRGTFVLQDEGTLVGTKVKGTWSVVPGSGTGELVGLRGEGGFEAELGQHASVWLDYRFDH
ncbi:MAG: DUF3224 domain-containing protein [Polyangiaceae bacterium]|nr:DUF3224 domain-containing protein [Polyangiaceae bacterium]